MAELAVELAYVLGFWLVCMGPILGTILPVPRAPFFLEATASQEGSPQSPQSFSYLSCHSSPGLAVTGAVMQHLPWSQGAQETPLFFFLHR